MRFTAFRYDLELFCQAHDPKTALSFIIRISEKKQTMQEAVNKTIGENNQAWGKKSLTYFKLCFRAESHDDEILWSAAFTWAEQILPTLEATAYGWYNLIRDAGKHRPLGTGLYRMSSSQLRSSTKYRLKDKCASYIQD